VPAISSQGCAGSVIHEKRGIMNSILRNASIRCASNGIARGEGGDIDSDSVPNVSKTIAGKVVAITGASSGIGAALARLAVRQGAHVVIGARRRERLTALADELANEQGAVRCRELDVTSLDDMQAFVAYVVEEFGRLDVLVNNAGVMFLSPVSALQIDDWNQMIDINLRGTLHGIAAALPVMQGQGTGQIINLAAGITPMTSSNAAVYAATKAAIRAISEGLRLESDQIRVTVVSPGVTDTELANHITDPVVRCETRAQRSIAISADAIASAILYAMEQPANVDVSEITVRPTNNPF
jgi:NADP-dependent 3-hydroxy acid dehydrogenase YdfG